MRFPSDAELNSIVHLPLPPNLYEGIANTNVQLFCFFSPVVMSSSHPI